MTILDKSAFQGLSRRESTALNHHLLVNVVPVLVHEIVGDLTKTFRGGAIPDEKVQELARKFGGSGTTSNETFRLAAPAALLGEEVPLTGQILLDGSAVFHGSQATLVEPSTLNELIMRLADRKMGADAVEASGRWRSSVKGLSLDPLRKSLLRRQIIFSRTNNASEVGRTVDSALSNPAMQREWVDCIVEMLGVNEQTVERIHRRWATEEEPPLARFAPYAHHVLRVMLMLFVACKDHWLNWSPTHLIDAQYLFYLPFCSVFASDDKVHRLLAPLLLRPEDGPPELRQSFITGRELKRGLRALEDFRDGLTAEQTRWVTDLLCDHPPPLRDNAICRLWQRHMRPWSLAMRNLASDLDGDELQQAARFVRSLFDAAGMPIPLHASP